MFGFFKIGECMKLTGYSNVDAIDQAEIRQLRGNSNVRFADKIAWIAAKSIQKADTVMGVEPSNVGVIVICEYSTNATMLEIKKSRKNGIVSPLIFSGANPGSLAGLACILFGYRGPSLHLPMPSAIALPVALTTSSSWLEDMPNGKVFVCMIGIDSDGTLVSRCVELMGGPDNLDVSTVSIKERLIHVL